MSTPSQLAAALGLEDPATFKGFGDSLRRTGRTTSMLLNALAEVSSGKPVTIAAYSMHYASDLVRQARDMAVCVGLDPKLILLPMGEERWRGSGVKVFRDHYYADRQG